MATIQKGSKINFYKFVDPQGGTSGGVNTKSRESKRQQQLTTTIKLQTTAINNLGSTVNSLGKVVTEIKRSQLSLLEAEKQRAKNTFKPVFYKPQKIKKFGGFDALFKGKIPSFWKSLLNLIGSFLKFFLVLPALKWLANPKNQDKVITILETLHKVFKFISGWAKFSINNTVDGLYDLLKDEATIQERIGGLFQAMAGLGAAFLGISILKNPLATVAAFKSVLVSFATGLKTAALTLKAHPLVAAALAIGALSFASYELIGKDLAEAREETDNTKRDALKAAPSTENLSPGDIEALIEGSRIKDVGGPGSTNNLNNMFTDPLGIRNDPLGTGDFIREFSIGGFLNGYAKGGWITGPQSGYPVSLDGNKPDFIGHGTEYVARRSDGGAFVVPFDTPATRKMPGLVNHRLAEAASQGFFDGGGQVSMSPTQRKALNILAKYESLGSGGYNAVNQWGSPDGTGNKYVFPDGSTSFAGDYRNAPFNPSGKPLTELTVKQILALQKDDGSLSMRQWADQGKIHAAGRYQFVGNTLPGLVERAKVPMDGLFDKKMQDILALQLMKERGIQPWVGPSLKATEAEKTLIELARKQKIPGYTSKYSSGNYRRKTSSFLGGLFNMLTGTGAAHAGEVNEMSKDTKVALASNLTSLKVIPASHSDTATGWGISGVTDKFGRPIVLSQPAAGAFLKMMVDSKGQVNASDVASSGRSIKKNASVGGHENSVHLYGEGLDLSGASHKWMLKNGIKYGWKYKYSHGPGSGHYDYVGVGSGSTPILSPFGGRSFAVAKPGRDPGGVRPGITTSGSSDFLKVLDGINFSKGMEAAFGRFAPMERNQGLMDAFGSMMGGEGATLSKPFFSTRRSSNNYEEQARIRRVTEQRNQARREINNKTNEIVQMALAAVESSNGQNRNFISIAEQGIRQLLGAQAGGGTFANVQGTTGTVLRTAVAVLNSFNNPLRGIFS